MTRTDSARLRAVLFAVVFAGVCVADAADESAVPRLYAIEHDGKQGFINADGVVVVEPQFDAVSWTHSAEFHDGFAPISHDGRIGFINAEGRVVIEPQYERAGYFAEGRAPVRQAEKWGYIDAAGAVVIDFQFNWASSFSAGRAAVRNEQQKWGYIDSTGALVVDFKFDSAAEYVDGWAYASIGKRDGFIDAAGNFGTPPATTTAGTMSEGLRPEPTGEVRYWAGGTSGDKSFDANGRHLRWGFVDVNGAFRIPPKYDSAGPFREGLARVQLNGKHGFIDPAGRVVIPLQFDSAWEFREGLAPIGRDAIEGYVNRTGEVVIAPQFDQAWLFKGRLAAVHAGDERGYIDRNGQFVWGLESFRVWSRVREIRLKREDPHAMEGVEEEIVLRSDGTASYVGNEHAKRKGTFSGKLERRDFRRMAELLHRSRFFEMPREADAALHAARITTAVTGDDLAHIVERDEDGQPIALWGANEAIASIASKIAWKRAAPGRKPQ